MNRTQKTLGIAAGATAAATLFYAFYVEPRWLQRTTPRLHLRGLPAALEGIRIGLLSDLHASTSTPPGLVARAVDAVMDAAPDLIAVTGDIAEDEQSLRSTLRELARLDAPLGTYIVPGNHDYKDVGIDVWRAAVAGVPSLRNVSNRVRLLRVNRGGDSALLCIAGVDDLDEGAPRLETLQNAGARDFTILLAHNPDQAERARRDEDAVDLVLSGHTHGGQVRLPLVGALVSSTRNPELYEAGVRRRPWTQVYTSRGVGTTRLRVRLLTRPEVAILTLTGEPRRRLGR